MMASVDSSIFGSATWLIRTSRLPCHVSARMDCHGRTPDETPPPLGWRERPLRVGQASRSLLGLSVEHLDERIRLPAVGPFSDRFVDGLLTVRHAVVQ